MVDFGAEPPKRVRGRMLRARMGRGLRYGALALTTIMVAGALTSDPAEARRRKPHHAKHHAAKVKASRAYTPPYSSLVVDANSGAVLQNTNGDALRHPASLTKLMTIYLTFSALDSGRLSLGDGLPVSVNALNAPPTKMGMTPGGTVNVRDATMALVTRSANDAAVLLAEGLAGSEEAFARLMTQKARQLGMSSTVFRNASGLPNSEQVTTARDLAKLANALLRDYPHYYAIFSVQSYSYRGRTLENHNRMLGSYDGADGLKTGYTNASGFNLVMSAMRDNRRLIGVVMGGSSAAQRDRTMAALMDRGFTLAAAMQLSPWTSVRKPPSARYTAAQFDPGASFAEAYRPPAAPSKQVSPKYAGFVPPAPATPAAAPAAFTAAPPAPTPAATDMPALGSWVIQVGSFSEPQAAQAALERATAALPDARSASAIVDEVQMANRVFHRARLINLSQDQAVEGCKRLEKRKVYCSALQVTAWNTPNAR
ncbi:MAG: D-alanyl-D-alanine carboxypeptidase [Proteobacteria bacterium]|nr:D-alanyl-D-alanine carboxypeptidase [Pseudomonadota bacterium]